MERHICTQSHFQYQNWSAPPHGYCGYDTWQYNTLSDQYWWERFQQAFALAQPVYSAPAIPYASWGNQSNYQYPTLRSHQHPIQPAYQYPIQPARNGDARHGNYPG